MIISVEPRQQDKGLTIDWKTEAVEGWVGLENETWWFRQSHLDTFLLCPERARLGIQHPELNTEGDAAMAGTAAHAAIEAFLNGEIRPEQMAAYAYEWAIEACKVHDINWQKFKDPPELAGHAARCAQAWLEGIAPYVPLGGMTEYKYKLILGEFRGRKYGIKGSIDYVPPEPVHELFDWKTSGSEFKHWEKQRWAIQPTAYAAAAHNLLGWEYPIRFTYGVMQRRAGPAVPQVLTVTRTAGHEAWLRQVIQSYMTLALGVGFEDQWPVDNTTALCSQTWCDHWTMCQGMFITDEEHRLPDPYRK